ncbi:hypothetical protein, partial [Yersinia pestis]|uniref:hypothetical protein n=3 Tax=Yersinia pestis TaxID=632 RepID=UPI001BB3923F
CYLLFCKKYQSNSILINFHFVGFFSNPCPPLATTPPLIFITIAALVLGIPYTKNYYINSLCNDFSFKF